MLSNNSKEDCFNKNKELLISLINEQIKSSNNNNKEQWETLKQKVNESVFNEGNFVVDIAKIIEIQNKLTKMKNINEDKFKNYIRTCIREAIEDENPTIKLDGKMRQIDIMIKMILSTNNNLMMLKKNCIHYMMFLKYFKKYHIWQKIHN